MNRPTPRKEHLVEIAQALFNQHGYHRTGIDTIMRESGVSKTTMYKYFKTKEELVLYLLEIRSKAILSAMKQRVKVIDLDHNTSAVKVRIDAVLDVVAKWVDGGNFFGCNFIRAVSEYESGNETITLRAREHKKSVKGIITDQLDGISPKSRDIVAEQIMLIIDGAIVSAHVRQRSDAIENARVLVHQILDKQPH